MKHPRSNKVVAQKTRQPCFPHSLRIPVPSEKVFGVGLEGHFHQRQCVKEPQKRTQICHMATMAWDQVLKHAQEAEDNDRPPVLL